MNRLTFILVALLCLFSALSWAEDSEPRSTALPPPPIYWCGGLQPCPAPSLLWCGAWLPVERGEINFYSEYGTRSTTEEIEEEDLDWDYDYAKGHFDFRQQLGKHFGYKLGTEIYDKDYKLDESRDNQFKKIFTSGDWFWQNEPIQIRWRLEADYRERRYENNPRNEYDQIKANQNLVLEDKDSWEINFQTGLDDYDYLKEKDKGEFSHFVKIAGEKYLLDNFLTTKASYKFRNRERTESPDREEEILKAGFDLKPEIDFLKLIRFHLQKGSGTTLDIEEREDAYDYNYRRWYILNRFKLAGRLKTSLRYEDLKKDYLDFNHNYRGFLLENNWQIDLLEDKIKTVALNLGFSRKEMDYPDAPGLSFNQSRGELGLSFCQKKNWKLKSSLDLSDYNFPEQKNKNKALYAGVMELERKFLKQAFSLNFRLRHVFKDYAQGKDIEQNVYRFGINYQF